MAGGLRGGWLLFLLAVPMPTAQEDGKAATLYCKCTWMDNWWFHLVEDLPRILGSAEDGKSMLARDETSNASRASSPSWKLLEKLVQKERLCRREPSLLELLTVETLCVPGTLATDLLCSLYYSFAFPTSEQLLRQSARRARRMRLLLYKAKDCLDATPWPFDVEDLEEYARSWLEFEAEAVETLTSPRTHPGIWRQLQELREELRAVRAANARAFESPGDSAPDTKSKATWDEVRQWVEEQLALPESAGGRQKIFPELDLLLSTRACVGKQIELPWFLLGGRAEDAGVELASRSGALCSSGLLVAGELVSRPGRRATLPTMPGTDGSRSRSNSHSVSGLHKLESYGLELMAPCRVRNLSLDGSCFCGNDPCTPWTQFGRECCREDDGLQWHGVGLLTGELRTNIAHFARDALWLHRLFQGPESLEALGSGQRTVERVLTKHAATECMENDRCVKTGRQVIFPMEEFMEEVAFEEAAVPRPPTFHAGHPDRNHTDCFAVTAQRWRPWPGDGTQVQAFRAKALRKCRITDRGLRPKILFIRRNAATRRWRDEKMVLTHLKAFATSIRAELVAAMLGHLSTCEQVEAIHDAMIMIAVHGADLTNMIFLPPTAVVLELGVECELEGSGVDSAHWRGPGTLINNSVRDHASHLWLKQQQEGMCPKPGETLDPDQWLQGYPISQFAKLARQANLFYTAIMDCHDVDCHREQEPGLAFDRTWCSSDEKKRPWVEVEPAETLIPTLWVIYDEYMRNFLPLPD